MASPWCLKAFSPEVKRPHSHLFAVVSTPNITKETGRLLGPRKLDINAPLASPPCRQLTTLHTDEAGLCAAPRRTSCATATLLASAITSGCLNGLRRESCHRLDQPTARPTLSCLTLDVYVLNAAVLLHH